MPPKRKIKKKAAPKKSTNQGRNTSKRAGDELTEKAEKTTGHLKKEDYLVIIDCLKSKNNYNACFGTWKAPLVEQPPKGTINGFQLMAINLRNQSPSKINLTSRQMKD